MKIVTLVFILSAFAGVYAAEDAEAMFAKAVAVLQESQADHSQLVQAIKMLTNVAEIYEKDGSDQKKAETVNACLYWAKKRMTLADTEAIKAAPDVGKRLAVAVKSLPADDAKTMLERADVFAREHGNNQLVVAIRYFEIADRFPQSDEGRKAMSESLAAMQKVGEKGKLADYKPAATDGRAFIQSEPPGAAIIFVQGDVKRDTGKKTPSIVQLPVGLQSLELELKGFKVGSLDTTIDEKAISKPNAVKLSPITATVDIIFEPGWRVFLDGNDLEQRTPATIDVPLGAHELALAKEGFRDVLQSVTLKNSEKTTVEPKGKPQTGSSYLLAAAAAKLKEEIKKMPGLWDGKHWAWNSVVEIKSDGTFLMLSKRIGGKWSLEGQFLILNWKEFPAERLKRTDAKSFAGDRFTLTRK